jgi:hypothetical protein
MLLNREIDLFTNQQIEIKTTAERGEEEKAQLLHRFRELGFREYEVFSLENGKTKNSLLGIGVYGVILNDKGIYIHTHYMHSGPGMMDQDTLTEREISMTDYLKYAPLGHLELSKAVVHRIRNKK